MNIVDMREYSDKRVIRAVLQKKLTHLPNFSVKFWETNNKLYLTSFSGGSKVEIIVSDPDRRWLTRSCASDRLYIASIAAYDRASQTISIAVLCYNEEKSLDLKCGANEEFIKHLKRSVMLSNPNYPYDSLHKMAVAVLSSAVSVYVLGMKLSAAEADDPDFLIVCSENEGYISLVEQEGIGVVCSGISSNIPNVEEKYRFYIVYGELEFLSEEKLREEIQSSVIEEIKSDAKSYLNLWQKVGEHEIRSALGDFSFGAVRCSFGSNNENELCFKADRVGNALQFLEGVKAASGTTLWVWRKDPSEIIDNIKQVVETGSVGEIKEIDSRLNSKTNERTTVVISEKYTQEDFRANGILPIDKPIGKRFDGECYLTCDPSGSYVMFRRRALAKEKIISGKNLMPCLAPILEDRYQGHPSPGSLPKIPVMDESSGSDFFKKHKLNETQYEAVKIALNTPDIVVIQGPPGTGKTTVIAAIMHRLNELSGDRDDIFGQNLVSAFQHVAVDNALNRMDIFGIPVIKIGEKKDHNSERRMINVNIENWMFEQQERVLSENPSVKRFSCDKRFNRAYSAYLCSSNSIDAAVTVLREAYDLLCDLGELASSAGKEVSALLERLSSAHNDFSEAGNDLLLDTLCRLPTNAEAYFDGGKRVINEAIALLNTHSEPVRNYSGKLESFLRQPDEKKDFSEMKTLRARIISQLKPKPNIFTESHDNCLVQKALTDVSELIQKRSANNEDPEEFALGDYFDSLCNDYGFVKETIISYSAICGATNQHSSSEKLFDLKESDSFDNVIIDEAARSNPLDLMIPMSLAKERIILVGDHRQLPHIIDSEIAQLVEEEVKDIEGVENLNIENELKVSLFERLKNILTDIESRDHIRRCITLNKQYRTHPELGNFVSRVFYEYHDKSEAFSSPRPASEFSHSLPGLEDKAAVWMDVPMNKGEEERSGKSFTRSCEARAIVKHIKQMMDSDAGKDLTFGIITFYAAQVEEIKRAMRDEGMADRNSQEFLLKEQYARSQIQASNGQEAKIVERLRIGSVDAFQGMEFDVVYLSIVRCNQQNIFGFLKMENRLCVAMSRQKRLLIAAGAKSMFETDASRTDVRQICEFLKLCESGKECCAVI